ncbi:neutral zinc metallopeptidase [Kribbella sp. CA-293567]|uniref:neutral zinc metallopeptidase n=1 Tax=Kribbella sp. CA-293567 TaxID=3002436 RepID=UPI0022DDD7E2|nr:neutral zinc metallopeptidase [Kribbella sp. CA-293567]WBQ04548.1 neutral zinc metallopeptidase [Kribbella sp. CA-293567]
MSDQQWSEPPGPQPPPAALPDGSIPLYGNYPLPGAPGGGPAQPPVGWGPDLGGGRHFRHGGPQPRRRPTGLLFSLLLLGGVAALVVTVALALRESDSSATGPAPGAGLATTPGTPDDSKSGTPQSQAATRTVTADAIYATGVQRPVGCQESPVPLSKQANVQAYYSNVVACLNKAWAPQVEAAKDPFTPPRLNFWSGVVQSPCATGSSVSFYCGPNRTVYLKFTDDIKLWTRSPDAANRAFARMWATYTAGHEYAHHLQQLTGIMAAAQQLQYDAPDQDARLELSRRVELQASCLSAVFTGANRTSYGINGLDLTIYQNYVQAQTGDENNRGGPRDHGGRANHLYWTGRGFTTLDSVSCNTFTATAGKVS